MKKISALATILFQCGIGLVVLMAIYLIYAVLDITEADMVNIIGFVIFQPIMGFIISCFTIAACLIVGLPIRLKSAVKEWWLKRPIISVTGAFIGLILLLLSFYPTLTETKQVELNGLMVDKIIPNIPLAITGWFMVAFFMLHFYPQSLRNLFRKRNQQN